jgi:(S)-mandelate dehydrogenase
MTAVNRHTSVAQLGGVPRRRFYVGGDLERAVAIADLRARTHRLMPRFVLEYLEGGAEDEATLDRERAAFADWRFIPHTLVDESHRSLARAILGRPAAMPLIVAPTGLNGLFRHQADVRLARGAAAAGVPFIQSTMSNDRMEEVARVDGLRHWWQLYVFGGDEVWQELVDRAAAAGCEALVLTTNSQIFGNREWDSRTRATRSRPSAATILDAALHPRWLAGTLAAHGMPVFANVIDFVPRDQRGFFQSAFWIRDQMPRSLSWAVVAKIRQRWRGPFLIKGILHGDDLRRAVDAGVDGVMLGSHGGRQMDWAVSALDILPEARRIVGDRIALHVSGGVRRGTDVLKALALGADAVLTGRATLYGLCAGGAEGVARALAILRDETMNALGQLGVASLDALGPAVLVRSSALPLGPSGAAVSFPSAGPGKEPPARSSG